MQNDECRIGERKHAGRLPRSAFPTRRAFTLIEMMVVLVLAAVLTTAVAVALTSPARAAQARDAAERIESFDRLVREHARTAGMAQAIVFDLNRGTVRRAEAEAQDGIREPGSVLQLPGQFRVERLLLPGGPVVSGEVRVPVSPRGQAPSYAILLTERRQKPHWLVSPG
jgi:prepilin-type N-terminal cleavage/methylation domain-containing protein